MYCIVEGRTKNILLSILTSLFYGTRGYFLDSRFLSIMKYEINFAHMWDTTQLVRIQSSKIHLFAQITTPAEFDLSFSFPQSDFYKYDLKDGHWERISEDTSKEGGPSLVFDHQVCYCTFNSRRACLLAKVFGMS